MSVQRSLRGNELREFEEPKRKTRVTGGKRPRSASQVRGSHNRILATSRGKDRALQEERTACSEGWMPNRTHWV